MAIILAGGASRRFGSDKAHFVVDGQTMLDRVIAVAAQVASPLLVVGSRQPVPAPGQAVADLEPGGGPVQAVAAALRQAPACDWLLLACDLPYLSVPLLRRLGQPLPPGIGARLVTCAGQRQFLPSFWSASAAPTFEAAYLAGQRALRQVAAELPLEELTAADLVASGICPHALRDVDRPDDLLPPRR